MASLKATPKQIIDYLMELKVQLEQKIFHIDRTISYLSSPSIKELGTATPSDVDQIDINGSSTHKPKNHIRLKPEEKFNSHSKLDNKIAFVLTQIGAGFKDDIVEELLKVQPHLDPYKLEKAIAVRLSYLLKIAAIQGRKISRRYEYSLFE
ncbi:soluble adenylyl cyclase-like protein [Olivibacter sp. SDN3]|uniref:soluble adenylyl cyclase-like protein n=1 Tax=Olivibacter sp. SDN3 TaxID=2764720 RepID=UPI0016510397|nr:soluble adenylyl cyclase-like protein [Olivibacter sp. SDN3]QNL49780.1 soluble adenylyl cyclase-like protein [Olivibacter sp. SDN3]